MPAVARAASKSKSYWRRAFPGQTCATRFDACRRALRFRWRVCRGCRAIGMCIGTIGTVEFASSSSTATATVPRAAKARAAVARSLWRAFHGRRGISGAFGGGPGARQSPGAARKSLTLDEARARGLSAGAAEATLRRGPEAAANAARSCRQIAEAFPSRSGGSVARGLPT
jgi:hypothetical protein